MNKKAISFERAFTKAMAAGKIRPCAKCGSANLEPTYYHGLIGIHCKDCYAPSVACYLNLETAIKKWNSN